jgi:hypothetical protein
MEETIMRLRSAQDMVRLLLGNADAVEADAVIANFVIDADADAVTKLS